MSIELTETERITLEHIMRVPRYQIDMIENLDIPRELRVFIIFDLMLGSHERVRKRFQNAEAKKESFIDKLIKRRTDK